MPNRIRATARRAARRLSITAPVAVRAAAADGGPRRFRMSLYTGEPLQLVGFKLPVVIDCATLDLSAQLIPALLDHQDYADCVVGQVQTLSLGANAAPPLVADGVFTVTDDPRDAGRFVLAKADAGFVWQASIGADPATLDKVPAGETVEVNGRTYTGPLLVARGCVPREASFVVLGADRRTSAVLARRRIKGAAAMSFEQWLMSLGFADPGALDDVQRANLQLLYTEEYGEAEPAAPAPEDAAAPAPEDAVAAAEGDDTTTGATGPDTLTGAAGNDQLPDEEMPPTNARTRPPALRGAAAGSRLPDPVATENQRIAANRRRVASIDRICRDAGNPQLTITANGRRQTVDLAAHAIAQGWTAQRTELEALRISRGPGPAVMAGGRDRSLSVEALSGAMILRAGGRLDHPAYQTRQAARLIPDWLRAGINDANRNRAMDAAHRFDDCSMLDICAHALRIDGRTVPSNRFDMIRAAFSGGALSNVFTTNVNAVLLSSYVEATDTTAGWTTETDVADFKTQERPRVELGNGLQKLPRGGEADHAAFADKLESYKIARYAKQFQVDEQDIIDDRLGALSDTPTRFGQAAARIRPDLVYSILLGNPTLAATARALFNSTDGNTATGRTLAAATLRTVIQALMARRENGVNLNLVPTHLIVPTDLFMLANELVTSQTIIIAGTAGSVTERGTRNVISDMNLTVVSDGRLTNGVTDPDSGTAYSGSASTWYLASTLAHLIEVAYLRGTGRAPRVRSWTMDREGKYGMGWDVTIDVGAKALDWKGFERGQT